MFSISSIFVCVGDCAAGHWCVHGIDRQYPNGINQSQPLNNSCYDDRQSGFGGICPVGHYCPGGTSSIYPQVCENGTYAPSEGMAACDPCHESKYSQDSNPLKFSSHIHTLENNCPYKYQGILIPCLSSFLSGIPLSWVTFWDVMLI